MSKLLQTIKSRRFLITAALIAGLILLNLAVLFLPFRAAYPDVSGSVAYRISDTTRRYLNGLTEDVEIIYYADGGRSAADQDLYPFLLQYSDANSHVTVKLEDISRTKTSAIDQSIEIRSSRRSRVLHASELYYYYNSALRMTLSLAEYSNVLQSLSSAESSNDSNYQSMLNIYSPGNMTAYFSGDANIIGAIRYVLAEQTPCIYTYSKEIGLNQFLRQQLEQGGYEVKTLSELTGVPEDCETLLLNVAADLTEAEAAVLSAYLENDGAVFLTTTYEATAIPNLSAVLAGYGLSAPSETNLLYDSNSPLFVAVTGDHPVTDHFSGSFVALYAHTLQTTETEGVTHSVLLRTSSAAYKITASGSEPEQGSFPLCIAAEIGDSKLIWLSMALDSLSNGSSGGANLDFAEKVIQWTTDSTAVSVNIPDTALPSGYINVSSTGLIVWIIFFIILIPLGLVAVGGIRLYLRKKK